MTLHNVRFFQRTNSEIQNTSNGRQSFRKSRKRGDHSLGAQYVCMFYSAKDLNFRFKTSGMQFYLINRELLTFVSYHHLAINIKFLNIVY